MKLVGAIVCSGLLSVLVGATRSAHAQAPTPENRLVQAFSAYCVATAAAPVRVRAAIKSMARLGVAVDSVAVDRWGKVALFETAEILDATGRSDPHQRMLITFGQAPDAGGHKRTCQVNVSWGDKAKLISEVVDRLAVAGGVSTVVKEGRHETDLTRWTVRVGNSDAMVELGMPTYAGAPGRALTLTIDAQ
jgi:hypothetical protein